MPPLLRLSAFALAACVGLACAPKDDLKKDVAQKKDDAPKKADTPGSGSAKTDAPKTDAPAIDVKVGKLPDLKSFVEKNKGQVVVMDFWATWCEPCKEMFPHLVALHDKHHKDGLRVTGVTIDNLEEIDEVKKFVSESKAYFPVVLLDWGASGTWNKAATDLQKMFFPDVKYEGGVPITLIFDRQGKLVRAFMDKAPEKELDAVVEAALAGKPVPAAPVETPKPKTEEKSSK